MALLAATVSCALWRPAPAPYGEEVKAVRSLEPLQQRLEAASTLELDPCEQPGREHAIGIPHDGARANRAGVRVDLVVNEVHGAGVRIAVFVGESDAHGISGLLSLTERLTKEQIQARMPHNLPTLAHMMQCNRDDFARLISRRTPDAEKTVIRKRFLGRRRKMLTLIEEMSVRTRRVQAMMRQMEDICKRMFHLRQRLHDLRSDFTMFALPFGSYVPNEEVGTYFAAADVVVLPYAEASQSGVVTVASEFGLPVVATRVGGLPDVIVDGETGLLVPPGDPAAIAGALARVPDYDPDELAKTAITEKSLARLIGLAVRRILRLSMPLASVASNRTAERPPSCPLASVATPRSSVASMPDTASVQMAT